MQLKAELWRDEISPNLRLPAPRAIPHRRRDFSTLRTHAYNLIRTPPSPILKPLYLSLARVWGGEIEFCLGFLGEFDNLFRMALF